MFLVKLYIIVVLLVIIWLVLESKGVKIPLFKKLSKKTRITIIVSAIGIGVLLLIAGVRNIFFPKEIGYTYGAELTEMVIGDKVYKLARTEHGYTYKDTNKCIGAIKYLNNPDLKMRVYTFKGDKDKKYLYRTCPCGAFWGYCTRDSEYYELDEGAVPEKPDLDSFNIDKEEKYDDKKEELTEEEKELQKKENKKNKQMEEKCSEIEKDLKDSLTMNYEIKPEELNVCLYTKFKYSDIDSIIQDLNKVQLYCNKNQKHFNNIEEIKVMYDIGISRVTFKMKKGKENLIYYAIFPAEKGLACEIHKEKNIKNKELKQLLEYRCFKESMHGKVSWPAGITDEIFKKYWDNIEDYIYTYGDERNNGTL